MSLKDELFAEIRRQIRAIVQEERRQRSGVVEGGPYGVVWVDKQGRVIRGMAAGEGAYAFAEGQSIANATMTTVNTFTSGDEEWDSSQDNGHNIHTGSAPDRITVAVAGYYLCGGMASFAGNATGIRGAELRIVGTGLNTIVGNGMMLGSAGHASFYSSNTLVPIAAAVYPFRVGDYLQMKVFQSSGGSLSLTGNTFMYMQQVG